MSSNRPFNIFVFASLAVLIALTVTQAFATAKVVASDPSCAAAVHLPSMLAARSNGSLSRYTTINGIATGVEGGLIELLSGQRVCDQ